MQILSKTRYYQSENTKVSIETRLYTWSVIFELLGYFTVPLFGQEPGVSRLLQVLVLLLLPFRLLMNGLSIPKPLNINLFTLYYFLAVIALVVAVLRGFYPLGAEGAKIGSSILHTARTSMSPIMNGALGYIIVLYYFFYFVVFPQVFIKNRNDVNYFINRFILILAITLVVGFADYAFSAFDRYYLTKTMFKDINVGNRFHAFSGEPRHAFVFLVMGFGVLYLREIINNKKVSAIWIVAIVAALIATKSFSGFVGVGLFIFMYGIYSIYIQRSIKLIVIYAVTLVTVTSFSIYFTQHEERLSLYSSKLPLVWSSLERERTLPWPFSAQGHTIYPLHDLTVKAREYDFVPVLIGSGLGSASVLSNIYSGQGYFVLNPSSQLVRVIYETGVIGLLLFVSIFLVPTKKLTSKLSRKKRKKIIIASLFVLAVGLAQRHVGLFAFFGILFVSLRIYWTDFNHDVSRQL